MLAELSSSFFKVVAAIITHARSIHVAMLMNSGALSCREDLIITRCKYCIRCNMTVVAFLDCATCEDGSGVSHTGWSRSN